MNRLLLTSLTIALYASPTHAAGEVKARYRADLAEAIDRETSNALPDLLTNYKHLHANPELSLAESKSAARIARKLETLGYSVTTNIGGHGLVGLLRNGKGPTVMIRGDMDALPITEETGLPYASRVTVQREDGASVGVMHACGHDVHQTTLVGAAGVLANLRDRWSGTVMILAQPAEEIGAGARMMIEDGVFDRTTKPNYCIALHVSSDHEAGTIAYTPGWALANVDSVDITIHGRGGHGSAPQTTIDPVMAAAQVVVALQTIVSRRVNPKEPAVITVGSIHAGSKHNIISNTAKLQLTVRSYTEETRKILLDGIKDVTLHTCRAMGCTTDPDVVTRDDEFTPSTYNQPQLSEMGADVFRQVLGNDKVVTREAVMGGEDFSRYPKHLGVPGFIFWLGSVKSSTFAASQQPGGSRLPSLHSSRFAPDPSPTIRTGIRCLTSLALSLLDEKK